MTVFTQDRCLMRLLMTLAAVEDCPRRGCQWFGRLTIVAGMPGFSLDHVVGTGIGGSRHQGIQLRMTESDSGLNSQTGQGDDIIVQYARQTWRYDVRDDHRRVDHRTLVKTRGKAQ